MTLILSRKGISPIIATILLVMMAIAIASSAFFWTSRLQNRMQGGIESYQEKQLTQLTTSAKIYDAEYSNATENLTIFIQNTGNTKLPIRDCCIWPRTDWILKNTNQNTICNTDWDPLYAISAKCQEGCGAGSGAVQNVEVGEIHKIVLYMHNSNCDISNGTLYPNGTVFSFSINFLGQTTAGGTFTMK